MTNQEKKEAAWEAYKAIQAAAWEAYEAIKTKCRVHLRSDPHGRCAVEHALVQTLTADRLALLTKLREYVNQIAYHDDWDCHVLDYDKIKAHLDKLINAK